MRNVNKTKFAASKPVFLKRNATELRFSSNMFDRVISKDVIERALIHLEGPPLGTVSSESIMDQGGW